MIVKVAGQRVGTSGHLYFVTQIIFVDVVEALSCAVDIVDTVNVFGRKTGHGDGGRCVIVASRFLGTTRTRREFAGVLGIGEVASEGQFTTCGLHHWGRSTIRTSVGQEIGHSVFIVVCSGITTASIEVTSAVQLNGGCGVVVTCKGDHTPSAALKLTAAIADIGVEVIVAGRGVDTAGILTRAIAKVGGAVVVAGRFICTSSKEAGSVINRSRIVIVEGATLGTSPAAEELARPIMEGGCAVVVTGQIVGTTCTRGHIATAIVEVGTWSKVASLWIGTPFKQARSIVKVNRSIVVRGPFIGTTTEETSVIIQLGFTVVVGRLIVGTPVAIKRGAVVIFRGRWVEVTSR